MEEDKNDTGVKTRKMFLEELAFAMNDHDMMEDQYLNLTQQIVSCVQHEDYSWGKKWPAEGDEVIQVEKIPTWKSFNLMEAFADSISDERISRQLYRALQKRHPFGEFRMPQNVLVSSSSGTTGVVDGRTNRPRNGCATMA